MQIVENKRCCGYRACIQICQKKAIKVFCDSYGFERIIINQNKCVDCGNCKKVCPILNPVKKADKISCGSAYSTNEKIKFQGSSGGLFGVFARSMIQNGGIVYGAGFDETLHLKTIRAETIEELDILYKSKYLLCDTTGAFERIKKDLDFGRYVLYTSSPCQIAALRNYIKKEYENLICIDFVCHGVGNQRQFIDSIKYIEQKDNIKIKTFGFREKFKKASSHYYTYYYEKNNKYNFKRGIYMTFPYYFAYEERLNCRESCYDCIYATEGRSGDITIGDFHNIRQYEPGIDRFAGVSMFTCNTKKGVKYLSSVKEHLKIKEYDWNVIRNNNRFSGEEIMPDKRSDYMELIANGKYEEAVGKFLNYRTDWRYYYYHLPKFIRELGNKLLRR